MTRGEPVKVSFFGVPLIRRVETPSIALDNQLKVASLTDLAGTKAKVINQRVELKDYLDIAALLDAGMTLPEIVAAAVAVFPDQVDYISTMSAITYFEDGDAKVFPGPLKVRLRAAARNASPVPAPRTSFASIVASAAAVGR